MRKGFKKNLINSLEELFPFRNKFIKLGVCIVFVIILFIAWYAYMLKTMPVVSNKNITTLKILRTKENQHSQGNNSSSFSFDVFGDNRDSIFVFNQLIKQVNNDNSTFAIDIGDLVTFDDKLQWRYFFKQISQFKKPILFVQGNHEAFPNGNKSFEKYFGPRYYAFAYHNAYFIMLDDSNEHCIDSQQYNWFIKQLKISQKYQYRFVFMHVPLYDPRSPQPKLDVHGLKDSTCAKKLNNLFDQYEVTMLFTSHIHGYFSGTWGKTPYIITGGAGAPMKFSNPDHYFFHYIKVQVMPDKVTYSPEKVNVLYPQHKITPLAYLLFTYLIYGAYIYGFIGLLILFGLGCVCLR